ncbi:hypothetical protein [Burkholderia pseudomallei]|uniref:hypothetical protein n=1 Tax=Burkholderia pseudomallei TaxID=28450 RepID=UPI000A1A0DE4|nr:hypothetical protein [Burkholderia pseudomallei]ARL04350.1 hypothetical protein BOC44_21530 [Burkholderia pseudomallei]
MMKKLQLGALNSLSSDEEEAQRAHVENEQLTQTATDAKPKKLQFGALGSLASGEDDSLREHLASEQAIEDATRGKPMKAGAAASEADAQPASGAAQAAPEAATAASVRAAVQGAEPDDEEEAARLAAEAQAEAEAAARAQDPGAGALAGDTDTDAIMNDLLGRVGNQPQPQQVVQGQVSGGAALADAAGHLAAGVVAAPFVALSSAYRLLQKTLKTSNTPTSPVPSPTNQQPGLMASASRNSPLAPIATMEMISNWKCDRIEEARNDVLKKADAIRELDGFPVWEESVLAEAAKRSVLPQDVVALMRTDPDLAPLREQMTALWRDNPKVVDAYRRSADTFEKHIKDVQKKFANSDGPIQKRVLESLETVREGVNDLPGYGREEGEYTATLAERLRELARVLAEFVSNLIARLQGRAPSAGASAAPEITG